MKFMQLDPARFRIVEAWDDNGDFYVTVEVGADLYVDVKYPNCDGYDLIDIADKMYSYPMYNADGGYVYSADSEGMTTADISEDDAWRVVHFVDDEIADFLG